MKANLKIIFTITLIVLAMIITFACDDISIDDDENSNLVYPAGSLDISFNFGGSGADNYVYSAAVQKDDKIIIHGWFSGYNGVGEGHIARLNSDGTLDGTFNTGGSGADDEVWCSAIQSDDKIIIGGEFNNYNGTQRCKIARLNSDGTLDTSFDPGTGVVNSINSIALQKDGKIIIGGSFYSYNGISLGNIARLNADGSLDMTFNPGGSGADYGINSMVLQSDEKIIICGHFGHYNGIYHLGLARLNTDGTLDETFNAGGTVTDYIIWHLAIQSDDKIIIGGDFNNYNDIPRKKIARLNADGTLDMSFAFEGTGLDSSVYSMALQKDGKIIVGGNFTGYNGASRNRIARLNNDGALDTSFDPGTGADRGVFSVVLQHDGKIIISGWLGNYNESPVSHLVRIWN